MNTTRAPYGIEVRQYEQGKTHHTSNVYAIIERIKRKPWLEAIGNFNPMFCTYKGKRTLVHSEQGDLSDPFRREESYLKTLFIEV